MRKKAVEQAVFNLNSINEMSLSIERAIEKSSKEYVLRKQKKRTIFNSPNNLKEALNDMNLDASMPESEESKENHNICFAIKRK